MKLIEVNSNKSFKRHCVESNCYVLLVDGREAKKEINEQYKQEINRFAAKVNENFVVIDAACHSEVLGPL